MASPVMSSLLGWWSRDTCPGECPGVCTTRRPPATGRTCPSVKLAPSGGASKTARRQSGHQPSQPDRGVAGHGRPATAAASSVCIDTPPGAARHLGGPTGVVRVGMGEEQPRDVGGARADLGQGSVDSPRRRPVEVDQGDLTVVIAQHEAVHEVTDEPHPPDAGHEGNRRARRHAH